MFSKNWFLWVVIVVAALVVWGLWSFGGKGLFQPGTVTESELTPLSTPVPAAGQESVFTPSQIQNYSDMVMQFGEKRIQFDERCQMTPADVTFKNGTTIMLDNRSGTAKTIRIGGQIYSFQPYGYRILTLSSPTLPNSLTISCDNSPNVGRILLQANILGQ